MRLGQACRSLKRFMALEKGYISKRNKWLVFLQAQARACQAAGFTELADALVRLRRTATEGLASILRAICSQYARAFFPR